jgi:hypothetical protein
MEQLHSLAAKVVTLSQRHGPEDRSEADAVEDPLHRAGGVDLRRRAGSRVPVHPDEAEGMVQPKPEHD